jgi:hypothetical protein
VQAHFTFSITAHFHAGRNCEINQGNFELLCVWLEQYLSSL